MIVQVERVVDAVRNCPLATGRLDNVEGEKAHVDIFSQLLPRAEGEVPGGSRGAAPMAAP